MNEAPEDEIKPECVTLYANHPLFSVAQWMRETQMQLYKAEALAASRAQELKKLCARNRKLMARIKKLRAAK